MQKRVLRRSCGDAPSVGMPMALIECLDYLPADHPQRKAIETIFQKLCGSIKNFQDKKNRFVVPGS